MYIVITVEEDHRTHLMFKEEEKREKVEEKRKVCVKYVGYKVWYTNCTVVGILELIVV